MSDRKEPTPIGRTVERMLEQMGAPPARTLSDLDRRWVDIVGPALAESTRPIELIDGVLLVACDDGAWASQVQWMESHLISRFGEVFPGVEVSRIRTRTSPRRRDRTGSESTAPGPPDSG